jgi:hypothetical protein
MLPFPPPRATRVRAGSLPAALLLTALTACTARAHRTGSSDLPRECEAFVATYETCLKSTLPSLPQVAQERAAQTRTVLQQEAERATSAPPSASSAVETQSLTALANKCQENLKRLTASCGAARTTN